MKVYDEVDREDNRWRRWLTIRRRWACGDLFSEPYDRMESALPKLRSLLPLSEPAAS
jgi:hypothetical protein